MVLGSYNIYQDGGEIMGTAQEWFRVLIAGSLFGGFMGMLGFPRPQFVHPPRIYWKLCALLYVLSGLCFGIGDSFGMRAFRPPLVFLTIGSLACALPVSWSLRRFNRTLPRLPKKPAPYPAPVFSRIEKKPDTNDVT